LGEPPRDPPRAAPDVGHPSPRHVAEGPHEELALPLVPQRVERVRRPERARHPPPRGGARVPVRRDAVELVACAPLLEELPDAGGAGAAGLRGRQVASVSMRMRASAASARAVASSLVAPWER